MERFYFFVVVVWVLISVITAFFVELEARRRNRRDTWLYDAGVIIFAPIFLIITCFFLKDTDDNSDD